MRTLQVGLPLGDNDILPGWAPQAARDLNKAEYQAGQRSRGSAAAT